MFLLLLVAGDAFEPAEGRDHAEEQVQFGVCLHVALLTKRHGRTGSRPGGEVVEDHFAGVVLDVGGVGIVGGQRVPVGDEEVALVLAPSWSWTQLSSAPM